MRTPLISSSQQPTVSVSSQRYAQVISVGFLTHQHTQAPAHLLARKSELQAGLLLFVNNTHTHTLGHRYSGGPTSTPPILTDRAAHRSRRVCVCVVWCVGVLRPLAQSQSAPPSQPPSSSPIVIPCCFSGTPVPVAELLSLLLRCGQVAVGCWLLSSSCRF